MLGSEASLWQAGGVFLSWVMLATDFSADMLGEAPILRQAFSKKYCVFTLGLTAKVDLVIFAYSVIKDVSLLLFVKLVIRWSLGLLLSLLALLLSLVFLSFFSLLLY